MVVKIILIVTLILCGKCDGFPLRFANYYESHMVLQMAPKRANIWGLGTVHHRVDVFIDGKNVSSATVDTHSQWRLLLPAMPKGGPHDIMITSGTENATIHDVLFGDVWICSGQSNMGFTVARLENMSTTISEAQATNGLRIFHVKNIASNKTQREPQIDGSWQHPGNDNVTKTFSAVCLLYALELAPHLNRPIGLVESAWGGTPIQVWSSPDAIDACKHHGATRATPHANSVLWNSMIAPITPMTVTGFIWYQGEANAGHAAAYQCQFTAMINDWRAKFRASSHQNATAKLPFGFVQLAPNANKTIHSGWPDLRWSQTAGYGYVPNPSLSDVFMSVAMDLPDFNSPYGSVHPRDKYDVADRLALAGRAVAYGEQGLDYQGPFPTRITTGGSGVTIEYDNGNKPIVVRVNRGFEICCGHVGDHNCTTNLFVAAPIVSHDDTTVTISASGCHGNTVVTSVRYAWEMSPCNFKMCAVYGRDSDLPAPSFLRNRPF
ncbi:sialate O-acetylesterase-like [Dreissena polymorpha]|nr:sialate O-acetylesterase-like [Dreissena polymorpha]